MENCCDRGSHVDGIVLRHLQVNLKDVLIVSYLYMSRE